MQPVPRNKALSITERVPPARSAKYDSATSVIDSGSNVLHSRVATPREIALRRSEVFQRISARELYRLVVSQETPAEESLGGLSAVSAPRVVKVDAAATTADASASPRAYVLFDVRDQEQYVRCHILDAVSCPAVKVNQDKLPPQLLLQRGKDNKMLIFYDEDERTGAVDVANKMCATGYLNVYVLTGGLRGGRRTDAKAGRAAASGGALAGGSAAVDYELMFDGTHVEEELKMLGSVTVGTGTWAEAGGLASAAAAAASPGKASVVSTRADYMPSPVKRGGASSGSSVAPSLTGAARAGGAGTGGMPVAAVRGLAQTKGTFGTSGR